MTSVVPSIPTTPVTIATRKTTAARSAQRRFRAQESPRLRELDGLPLATFGQRLLGYAVDLLIALILWAPAEVLWRIKALHQQRVHIVWNFHEAGNLIFLVLYFGLANYIGNGTNPSSPRTVAVDRKSAGLWSRRARRRARVPAVFLERESHVRAGSPRRNHGGR